MRDVTVWIGGIDAGWSVGKRDFTIPGTLALVEKPTDLVA